MNMLSQIIIELTDEANIPDDVILEVQALRLLDEAVRDAANKLTTAQANLADMTKAYQFAQNNLSDIMAQIQTHEGYALQAIHQENHALALEVAEKIASLEQSHAEITAAATHHANECETLTDMLHQNEHNLYVLKQQIDTIKANQSVHRAQVAVCERYGDIPRVPNDIGEQGSVKLRTALDALAELKQKQQYGSKAHTTKSTHLGTVDTLKNVTDVSEIEQTTVAHKKTDDLLTKLQAAGIASGNKKAEDVLTRIKNNTNKN